MVSVLLLAMIILPASAEAETDYRIANNVVLRSVRITPVQPGDRTQITFVLENRGAERILFGGITVTDARHSRIVAAVGNGATTTLDSIPVAPGETLTVDGKVLWIEVDGPLGARDGTIEAKVRFGMTVIPIDLSATHVIKPSS